MDYSIANGIKLITLASVMVIGTVTADAAEVRNKRSKGVKAQIQVQVPQKDMSVKPKRSKGGKAPIQMPAPQKGLSAGPLGGAGVADLVILPWHGGNSGQPNSGYCGAWNGGNQKVYFYVKNIGSGIAAVSDVYIGFNGGYNSTITVPQLAPNQSTLRSKTIPAGAWGPTQYHSSVQFLIAADHNDETTETNVTNNYGEGTCVGPAT